MLKCCRRMAKLSHAPSTANLLAQYTSLKGRPVPEIAKTRRCFGNFKHDSEQKHVLFPSNPSINHPFISPWSPPVLPVTKMWPLPRAFMSGKKAWIVWMVPRRLTSRTFLIASKDCTSNGPIKPTPALHTESTKKNDAHTHATLFFRNYWAYPERLFVSPQSSPSPLGWTAGWSHPFGVCPRCPCAAL